MRRLRINITQGVSVAYDIFGWTNLDEYLAVTVDWTQEGNDMVVYVLCKFVCWQVSFSFVIIGEDRVS